MTSIEALDARLAQIEDEISALQAQRAALRAQRNALAVPFYRLPSEVLAMITRHFHMSYKLYDESDDRLDLMRDAHGLACSCRRLREMTRAPELWTHADILWDDHWMNFWWKSYAVAKVCSVDLRLRTSDPLPLQRRDRYLSMNSLFVIMDVPYLLDDREWYPLYVDEGLVTLRILFTKEVLHARTFDQVIIPEQWENLTTLTLEGAKLIRFPEMVPSLEHLKLINVELPLEDVHEIFNEALGLESITFINVTTGIPGQPSVELDPAGVLEYLCQINLSGDAFNVLAVLALLPDPNTKLQIELNTPAMGTAEDRVYTECCRAIALRIVNFWRTTREVSNGFSTGSVEYSAHTEGRIHFFDAVVPTMSWTVAPALIGDASLLDYVHTLELDCRLPTLSQSFRPEHEDTFVAGLPMHHLHNLKTFRICYLGGESDRVSTHERICQTIEGWLREREQPWPLIRVLSRTGCARALCNRIVEMGRPNSVTWSE
jgi:hypothetical protein